MHIGGCHPTSRSWRKLYSIRKIANSGLREEVMATGVCETCGQQITFATKRWLRDHLVNPKVPMSPRCSGRTPVEVPESLPKLSSRIGYLKIGPSFQPGKIRRKDRRRSGKADPSSRAAPAYARSVVVDSNRTGGSTDGQRGANVGWST